MRHGRRRRTHQQLRNRGDGRSFGAMDRAPPFSGWRRDFFPSPNQPVPPPRATRYPVPQTHSYAEATRSTYPHPARRGASPRASGPEVRREPASPEFGRLVRKLHTVIKLVHHSENVSQKPGTPQPRMISRMVDILAGMIKPAAPTQRTVDLVTGNAKDWGQTTCLILKQHYDQCIEDLLEELSGLLTPGWEEAFEVAVRWAKRNLPRITQDVLYLAEDLVTARMDTGDTVQGHAPLQARDPPRPVEAASVQTQVPQQAQDPPRPVEVATVQTRVRQEPRVRNLDKKEEDSPQVCREVRRVPRRARGQPSTGDNLLQDVVVEQQKPVQTTASVHLEDDEEDPFEESFDYFSSPQPHWRRF